MTGLSEMSRSSVLPLAGWTMVKPLKVPEVLARLATHLRNAHVSRLAREAVDVAGLGVLLVDRHGRIAWRSPQAVLAAAGSQSAGRGCLASVAAAWAVQQGQALAPLTEGSSCRRAVSVLGDRVRCWCCCAPWQPRRMPRTSVWPMRR